MLFRSQWSAFAVVIVCGLIFYRVRLEFGLYHTVWLIGIVVVTDTAGYLIGRIIGGPKVFPRISPKKTWAGVLAGWFAVGLFSWSFVENGYEVVRAAEEEVILSLNKTTKIISTGGSAIYSKKSMEHLKTFSSIIYIKTQIGRASCRERV